MVLAQNMKIKNGTNIPLTSIEMNYEEHATGNLLDQYNANKALQPGESFTLPHCKTFGAGNPLMLNVSAIDSDDDLYSYGEVDICKTREIIIKPEHLQINLPEAPSEEEVYSDTNPATNQVRYDDFVSFIEGDFGTALKSGLMSKLKAHFTQRILDGLGVNIEGQTTFTQAMLNKAKVWYLAGKLELTPRAPFGSFEFSKKLYPVMYLGDDLHSDPNKGFFFVFDRQEDHTWKLDMMMDADQFASYTAVLEGELDEVDELADEVTTEGDQDNERLQVYDAFRAWLDETLLPVLKANDYNKFMCLFGEDCDTDVTRSQFLKLARFYNQTQTFESMPNEEMDFSKPIDPISFFGKNYNEESEDGFYLSFRPIEGGQWRIRKVTPAKEYQ